MSIDNSLIGSVINALPMDRMIAAPLQAMVQAQVTASKSYADFLMQVCVQDGKAVAIQFDYDETIVDEQGEYKGVVSKSMKVPLLAAITHPNITIEEGNVEFELTISQMAEDFSESNKSGEVAASLGWGLSNWTSKAVSAASRRKPARPIPVHAMHSIPHCVARIHRRP
ncbi:DUF2589 domain-containing protein [Pseudomonas sp. PCH44]|uniref:DUF2589 domain-containing protein n=1 Tax=Pseudomonas sp. PCH44 TaxID=2800904 RepID=UPI00201686F8|nr:DUF2589 domain-containing protein [Pseudomonas sp. PCH44]